MHKTRETVIEWLDTFSTVKEMAEKPEAMAKEIDTIEGVFTREGANAETIEKAFQHIKITSQSRAWPTAAQVYEALRFIKRETHGEHVVSDQGGDRMKLDAIKLATLETQIIPTARRWLRMFPGLRSQAINTLKYWGEPLVDDMGKKHKDPDAKGAA